MNRCQMIAALVAGTTAVLSAEAQTLNIPTFYMWGEYPADTNVFYAPTTSKVKKIVQFNLNAGWYENGQFIDRYRNNPEKLAEHVAAEVYSEVVTTGRLANETITVLIQNFGYDSPECDAAPGQPESDLGGARFFLSSDRLPGIGEFENDLPPRFPVRRTEADWDDRETLDYGYARSYRHPFLANGKDGAPLKAWFERFVNRLDQEYTIRAGTPNAIPHPSTYRYYFDIEPLFVDEAGANGVWFLDYLANPGQYGHSQYSYWNNPSFVVPGTGGKTLQQCYNEYRTANGYWDWPVDNPSTRLTLDKFWYENENAPYLTWYSELCTRVRDEVLDRCFHRVLRDKWPGSGVRSGNYGDFSADGLPDTFGWEGDRPWVTDLTTSNLNPPSWTPREGGARFARHKARGGPRNYISSLHSAASSRRMLDFVTSASGTTDSPVAYALGYWELEPLFGQPGWRRKDLYEAGHPNEEDVEAAIRFHRHTAESILNTPGTGLVNVQRNLAPWLTMPRANDHDDVPEQFEGAFTSRRNTRALMGMFRGKNIKEGMFWTKWYITANEQQDPPRSVSLAELLNAWEQTQRSVVEVYSTKVRKYTRTWSQSTLPAVVYEDAGETQEQKASRLEFTLREFPQTVWSEREVRLNSRPIPILNSGGVTQTVHQTVLTVDFDWIDTTYAGAYDAGSGSFPESRTKAEVNIECSIEFTGSNSGRVPTADDFGRVQMWMHDPSGVSAYADLRDLNFSETYTFVAPRSVGDNRWRMRVQFIANDQGQYVFPDTTASNAPISRIRLIHQSPVAFKTRYDLLQMIPTDEIYYEAIQPLSANSDMNHDGVVDPMDLMIYLDEWMMDSPAADFDADSSVTGQDADAFIEAYINGT